MFCFKKKIDQKMIFLCIGVSIFVFKGMAMESVKAIIAQEAREYRSWDRADYNAMVACLEKGRNAAQNSKNWSLQFAVWCCVPKLVQRLIANGAQVDSRDDQGRTPLWVAITEGYGEIVNLLISAGAKANHIDGTTPLYWAVRQGREEIAKFLISNGAVINDFRFGCAPLHEAAKGYDLNVVALLIKHDAKVNVRDNYGRTPLHYAVHVFSIAKLLIEKEADVNVADSDGRTPLHEAVLCARDLAAELLIEHNAKINASDNYGCTPLHYAVRVVDITKFLLFKGAQVNVTDIGGRTPLHYATLQGNGAVINLLICKGALINSQDNEGRTPLYFACLNNLSFQEDFFKILDIDLVHRRPEKQARLAELLLKNNADINLVDKKKQRTPLLEAASAGNLELTEFLILHGADLNARDRDGQTALHRALQLCKSGYPDSYPDLFKKIAIKLISVGADLTIRDSGGKVPYDYAQNFMSEQVGRILQVARFSQALVKLLEEKKTLTLAPPLEIWFDLPYSKGLKIRWGEKARSLATERINRLHEEPEIRTTGAVSKPLAQPTPVFEDCSVRFNENYKEEFNIGLALDGEGLQALVTASMVKRIENELKCRIYELFDCISGTSFGGILTLGLTGSKDSNHPICETEDIIKLFERHFSDNDSEKIKRQYMQHVAAVDLQGRLQALFKGVHLSDSLTRVLVPCRKVTEKKLFVFDSKEAQKRIDADYYMRHIASVLAAIDNQTCVPVLGCATASSEYKNKAAELLFKKMRASLDENQREKLHILYCASSPEPTEEGHTRVHEELTEELNSSSRRYCRIKPAALALGSFDSKELVTIYKEKGEEAAEDFLKGGEAFVRKLLENRSIKHRHAL